MENRKLVRFLIPIFVLGFFVLNFNSAFAYDTETHAYLTSEIIKFYNQNFPNNQISDELKPYLLDGSRREDDVPRWMNHFYDPVYNRGLTDSTLGTWQKSKDWAQDSNNQNSLTYKVPATIASILTAIQQLKISALSTETDFTWQRAIKFYAQGEKEKAMFILGHILHLIEDASVPDHTRNDPHPGDSPYENYTQQFTLNNPDKNLAQRLQNKNPVIFSSLNSYFDELANYSNNNFYSKDTIGIQSGYKLPEPESFELVNNVYYGIKKDDEGSKYHLLLKKSKGGSFLVATEYDLTIDDKLVKDDYWSRLSTKSVQYGAGVINLFFREAEKATNDPNFVKTEEKSFLSKAIDTAKNLVAQAGDFFSGIFGANQGFESVSQVATDQSQEPQPSQNTDQSQKVETPKVEPPKVNQQDQAEKAKTPEVKQPSEEIQPPQINEIDNQLEIEPLEIEEEKTEEEIQQEPVLKQTQPTSISKQCSFNTNQSPTHRNIIINEVAWMGMPAKAGETSVQAANNEWIELKNISTSQIDLTGWQLIDKDEQIKIDLSLLKKTKLDAGKFILLERKEEAVPNIPADLIYSGALSNTDEGLRLFDNNCNLIDEVLANPNWPAGDNTTKRTMERKSGLGWQASAEPGGTPKAENSSGYLGYGGGGGSSLQSTPANNSTPAKILITEVQITGGPGKTENDFIELYNPNSSPVNLNGYRLVKRTKTGTSDSSIKSWTTDVFIPANGYYLWANSGYTDIPVSADVTTSATISNDNGIAIRFGPENTGQIIDSVAWGAAENNFIETQVFPNNPGANQSIQRKFQNNTFIDTDNNANDFEIQTCPSPKAQSRTCSSANQAPSAFFVYSPQNPRVSDVITFNATSSSDPDGNIISYQWNFGDNQTASTTQATITHSYLAAGNYLVQLTVFDNQNASSTASLTVSVVSIGANHIVISEILFDAAGGDEGKEFIELYNPTNQEWNLSGWSLKHLKENSTSTELLATFGGKTEDKTLISNNGFLLIGLNNYEAANYNNKLADILRSATLPNGEKDNHPQKITVILYDAEKNEIDRISYDKNSISAAGQSLERKAFSGGVCVSAQNSNEFLGNGCDTDSADDFEIRDNPNPQNSQSFPEPRSAPTMPENFNIVYSSSTMELIFNWQSSQDYSGATSTLTYKIVDISNASSTLPIIETASTTAKISIDEVGRDYNFSIQAFDKDGLGSATSTKSISVPSFLSGLYFYQDPRASSTDYLIEAYYNQYPFVPDLYYGPSNTSWKLLVFYLNSEAEKQLNIDTMPYGPADPTNVLAIKYKHCSGGSITRENSLLLADISSRCGTEGDAQNVGFAFSELEDNHFMIYSASSTQEFVFSGNDFITVAFYSPYSIGVGPIPHFRLVAVDKTKYYFGSSPTHQPPQLTGSINLNFDRQNSRLYLDWPKATDPDTLDYLLTYEIKFNDSGEWQLLGNATGTSRLVAPGDSFFISVRAKDDFGDYSNALSILWSRPEMQSLFVNQTAVSGWSEVFGQRDGCDSSGINLQSIIPESDFQFNTIVLKIKQSQAIDSANLKLSVYTDDGANQPDFNHKLGESIISNLFNLDGNQDVAFSFSNPIPLLGNTKYWLSLEVDNYNTTNSYNAWHSNSWQNAVASGISYPNGEFAKIRKSSNGAYSSSVLIPDLDWYMKIGLESSEL